MNGSLDPQVMSAEGERMEQVLRLLEDFVPAAESNAPKLPRLSGVFKAAAPSPDAPGDDIEPAA